MPIESIVLNACLAPEYQCTVRCSAVEDDTIPKEEWSRKFKTAAITSKSKSIDSHSRSTQKTRRAGRAVAAGGEPMLPPIYYEDLPKFMKKDQKQGKSKKGNKKYDDHSEAPSATFTKTSKTSCGSGSTDSTSSSTSCSSSSSSSYSSTSHTEGTDTIDQSTLMPPSTIAPSTITGNNSTTTERFLMNEMVKKAGKNKNVNNLVSLVSSSESYGSETLNEEEEIAKRVQNIVSMVMSSDDSDSASGLECALTNSTGGSKTTKTNGSYATFDDGATTLGNSTITTRRSLFRWRKSKGKPFAKYDSLPTPKQNGLSTMPSVFGNNTVKTNNDERTQYSKGTKNPKNASSSTRKGRSILGISRSFRRKTSVDDPKPAEPKINRSGQEAKSGETATAWQF